MMLNLDFRNNIEDLWFFLLISFLMFVFYYDFSVLINILFMCIFCLDIKSY